MQRLTAHVPEGLLGHETIGYKWFAGAVMVTASATWHCLLGLCSAFALHRFRVTTPTSFRLSEAATELLESLSSQFGLKRSGVVELALRELAEKHGSTRNPQLDHPQVFEKYL